MIHSVLIRGHIFPYEEKAPFVASGKSVLGAIEYDIETQRLRCHECGDWFPSVGRHLRSHHITSRSYKLKHGLNVQTSSLNNPEIVKRESERLKKQMKHRPNPLLNWSAPPSRLYTPNPRIELANETGKCRAQLLYRVQIVAAQVQHTPNKHELKAAGIQATTLIKHFGSLGKAMERVGLIPNKGRKSFESALPFGFEAGLKLDNRRMPWPDDYIPVAPFETRY